MKEVLIVALSMLGLVTPGFGQRTIRMVVKEECVPCRRMMPQTCFQVQKDGSKTWELFYDRIAGFEYVAGNRYVIDVIETPRPEPVPQDLSKCTYALGKIISVTPKIIGSEGSVYRVIRMNGKDLNNANVSFSFDSVFKRISGRSGCNNFFSAVKLNKKQSKICIKTGGSTMMACQDMQMEIEKEFLSTISNKSFKISHRDDKMIWTAKKKEVFVFERVERKPQPEDLATSGGRPEKTPWNYFNQQELKLIQIDGVVIKDVKAGIKMDMATNSFTGSNGCNRISGTLSTTRNTVEFLNIMSTKMLCVDELVATTEKRFMEILSMKGLTVDFAEQVFNVYDANGKLALMFAVDTTSIK
ncbi:META domain-containing protein [Fluviicola sp.]|jgi:heat shock protein HslJ|uniref:META domain-containing protein n=1 Tax=Fluviicola sp. TaxID=1917219 RepID=UPI0028337C61|nr:META domain-containing protein [Fluviicola sp.]MDR0802631.1 META domain-containing protein [Fluviicola sp.]